MSSRPRQFGMLECNAGDGKSYALPDLYCPAGHRIPWEWSFHEGGFPRCQHREKNGGRNDCNARLFVSFFPRINPDAKPMMLVAEISYEEIQHVTQSGMDVPAIVSYLGLSWAPRKVA